ncbi:amino acid adenylation domain-containing protein [Streptomyces yunnanensis]|uniref:Amino acid adenylation domain-containing protein n=1 Tax=Streptomyces yunnanensis TaxID=156453 RepID=A0ABY8AG36_9ACTN|nr:amino acid adenylation domain-containing protein [Streptomyces yunnanensis]WEB43758.1 amino acid adenylation domain-containing protein [Streptomyces yunnanensis]
MGIPTDAGPDRESGIVTAIPWWRTAPRQDALPTTEYACLVPAGTVEGLTGLAERLRVGFGSVLLAAHAKVLAALTGESDVLTGYAAPGGDGQPLPHRLPVTDGSWRKLVLTVHQTVRGEQRNPAAEAGAAAPEYEVVLDLSALDAATGVAGRVPDGGLADGRPLPAPLVLRIAVTPAPHGGLRLRLTGRGDVLDLPYAQRIAGYLLTALTLMTGDDTAGHHCGRLLSPDELAHQIDGLAGPVRDLPDRRMHELFEERVRQHPDLIAAVHDGTEWTYGEVNRRANRIAHALLDRGLRPEDVVAVVTERNLGWLAAALGVFKAGGVYLPVEPHFPASRIAAMLGRSECRFVLTEPGSTGNLDQALTGLGEPPRLLIADLVTEARPEGRDDTAPVEREHRETDPGVPVSAGQLAYVYFTSGSTGEPKGAMCEHAGMLNHLLAKIEDLEIGPGQTVAQTAPQCFDISLWQLVSGLLVGARTLIIGQKEVLDVRRCVDTLVEGEVEVLQVVPSYLEVMLTYLEEHPRSLGRLRSVSATGEALKKELVERWFAAYPDIRLVNAYGLTETSDDTNHEVMERVPGRDRVPLGSAVRNVRVYVVDEHLEPVPLGAPGEIVFSGVCVGRGYINDPERTAAAFGTDPHRPGERLYRSGDIGRWLPEGTLEFLGRRDAQTKIRGFRIEIGEIENHLLRVPGVRDSAVVVAESPDREKHLVAFYAADVPLDADAIRQALADTLPPYMVPGIYRHRDALPLTGNGKIDKKALTRDGTTLIAATAATASPEGPLSAGPVGDDAPRTATEQRLARIWAQVLSLPVTEITRNHHFFASGGTSLSAVRLGIALGGPVTLQDIVDHPVLAELASAMDERDEKAPQEGEAAPPAGAHTPQDQGTTAPTWSPAAPAATGAGELGLELAPGKPPVLRVTEDVAPGRLADWTGERRAALEAALLEHGAVLIRGLGVRDAAALGSIGERLSGSVPAEREAFARRRPLGGRVLSSLEWPADQPMCMHHELSYGLEFPRLLTIGCFTAPATGGVTGLADAQAVLAGLPQPLVERFTDHGWSLLRSYNDLVGVGWQEALAAADRAAAEAYCRANGTAFAWQPDGGLHTTQRRSAVIRHPLTGRPVWFNQIAFLNEWTMDPAVREYLVMQFGEQGLPFNTCFGDGSPIDRDTIATINEVYEAATLREPWQAGDVLLVDNIRMAHSREPYEGQREVGMVLGAPVRLADCSPTHQPVAIP